MLSIQDKVRLYSEELSKNEPVAKFSFAAFVFNSFYYVYYDMMGKFFIYALAPLFVFYLLFALGSEPMLAYVLAYLAVRVVAGFRAPQDVRNYKIKYIERFKDVKDNAEFYPAGELVTISALRFFMLSLLSFGIYYIYWGYKNWKAVRYQDKVEIFPALRGCFFILFIYPLAQWVKDKSAGKVEVSNKVIPCSILFIVFYVLGSAISHDSLLAHFSEQEQLFFLLADMVVYVLAMIMLIPLQNQINRLVLGSQPLPPKKLDAGEVISVILGLAMLFGSFAQGYSEAPQKYGNSEYNQALEEKYTIAGYLSGVYYRHVYAYADYCRKQGYEMQHYPEAFKQVYSAEYAALNNFFATYGGSFDEALSLMTNDPNARQTIEQNIANELETVRRHIIFGELVKNGQQVNLDEWDAKYDNLLSIKDVCAIIDDEAFDIQQSNHSQEQADLDKLISVLQN